MSGVAKKSYAKISGPTIRGNFMVPLKDRVLLQIIDPDEFKSALIIPSGSQSGYKYSPVAWCLAAGDECKLVKKGDLCILIAQAMGDMVVWDSVELALFQENQIGGVVTEQELARIQEKN